jgi:sugar (pentulose or hexulose) kinase
MSLPGGALGLGIDLGTSGVRAALLDQRGEVRAETALALAPAARRDPEALWEATARVIGALPAADREAVRRIAVDGTSGSLLVVDERGRPLTPLSLYNDRAPPAATAAIAARAPLGSPARGETSPLARALPHLAGEPRRRLLHEADWIVFRLTGRLGLSDENNALKTGYDPLERGWPEWVLALGLTPAQLPAVHPAGTPLAPLHPACAAALGLPRAAEVVAGTTDGCAAFLATGANRPGEGASALGSTLTLKMLTRTPVFAPEFGVYSHRLGEWWLAGGASNAGGAVLAAHFSPAEIAALSAAIDPARPSGLDYYPLLAPGERFPINDPELPPRLTPRPPADADFLHGLLEGLARIEAEGYRRLTALGADPLIAVRSTGGGAANPTFTAIRARFLGVPLLPAASQSAAAGAARLALGLFGGPA